MICYNKCNKGRDNMKVKLLPILFSTLLMSCNNIETSSEIEEFIKVDKQMSIMIASDLHLLSNNLVSKDNKIYTKENITRDGRVQEYDYELAKELVIQTNINKPDYLILTGDLTFNGEKDSHIELIKILNEVNKETKVLVLPVNHDYNNVSPQSMINDQVKYTDGLQMEEFKEFYKDFGYTNAYSYDEDSLSYIYQ